MNSIDLTLLELLQVAETPVYSAHGWLGRRLGHDVALDEFLSLVAALMRDDVVRLWVIDAATHERTRLSALPSGLPQSYRELPVSDDAFDPFGLSLTLNPTADLAATPVWQVDLDFEGGSYILEACPRLVEDASRAMQRTFPDVVLVEIARVVQEERVRVTGTIEHRPSGD